MKSKIVVVILFAFLEFLLVAGLFDFYPLTAVPAIVTEKRLTDNAVNSFKVIRDSFIYTKSLSSHVTLQMKQDYAWSLLDSVQSKSGIAISLYDARGMRSVAPGRLEKNDDPAVLAVIQDEKPFAAYTPGEIYAALPVFADKDCLVCHRNVEEGELCGAMSFRTSADYYKLLLPERKLVLIVSLLLNSLFLALSLLYVPFRRINKLFEDKH